jgi:hypothetical protein
MMPSLGEILELGPIAIATTCVFRLKMWGVQEAQEVQVKITGGCAHLHFVPLSAFPGAVGLPALRVTWCSSWAILPAWPGSLAVDPTELSNLLNFPFEGEIMPNFKISAEHAIFSTPSHNLFATGSGTTI